MKKIIVSAFGPFSDYKINSSATVANLLRGIDLAGYRIVPVIFPANIPKSNEDRGKILFSKAVDCNAKAIISLGMASDCRGMRIEHFARNKIFNLKYCPPDLNGAVIDSALSYDSVLPMNLNPWHSSEFAQEALKIDVKVEFSADAGGFCCNHLAYQLARQEQRVNYK
mgnify:CR=1 FL=1